VDAGANDAHRAETIDEADTAAEALAQDGLQAIFVVQVLARDRNCRPVVEDVELLAGNAALVEDGEDVTARRLPLEDDNVALAGDADNRTGKPRCIAADDGAVG